MKPIPHICFKSNNYLLKLPLKNFKTLEKNSQHISHTLSLKLKEEL